MQSDNRIDYRQEFFRDGVGKDQSKRGGDVEKSLTDFWTDIGCLL
jgi:hypothetical protein